VEVSPPAAHERRAGRATGDQTNGLEVAAPGTEDNSGVEIRPQYTRMAALD